jgi:hypothetical protein
LGLSRSRPSLRSALAKLPALGAIFNPIIER